MGRKGEGVDPLHTAARKHGMMALYKSFSPLCTELKKDRGEIPLPQLESAVQSSFKLV
jgi:hypothetical protein